MKNISILLLVLFSCVLLRGAVQPVIGSTELMKANNGRGTNAGLYGNTLVDGALTVNGALITPGGTFRLTPYVNTLIAFNGDADAVPITIGAGLDYDSGTTILSATPYENQTNTFSGTTFWFGTNQTIVCSSNIYITALGNIPTTTERLGQLTIVASGGNVTVTNLRALKTSDMLTSRVLTNGNTLVIGAHVQVPLFTNAAIVQFY